MLYRPIDRVIRPQIAENGQREKACNQRPDLLGIQQQRLCHHFPRLPLIQRQNRELRTMTFPTTIRLTRAICPKAIGVWSSSPVVSIASPSTLARSGIPATRPSREAISPPT